MQRLIKSADVAGTSAETNPTYDQIPLRAILFWQDEIHQEQFIRLGYGHYMRYNE
jgi:hypothetical protein